MAKFVTKLQHIVLIAIFLHTLFCLHASAFVPIYTVLGAACEDAAYNEKSIFIEAEKTLVCLYDFSCPDGGKIFKSVIDNFSSTLASNYAFFDDGVDKSKILSTGFKELGEQLASVRAYLDNKCKRCFISQTLSLPDSGDNDVAAKAMLLSVVRSLPSCCGKQFLISQIDELSDVDAKLRSEMCRIVSGFSEWCPGRNKIPSRKEIVTCFCNVSDYFKKSFVENLTDSLWRQKWLCTVCAVVAGGAYYLVDAIAGNIGKKLQGYKVCVPALNEDGTPRYRNVSVAGDTQRVLVTREVPVGEASATVLAMANTALAMANTALAMANGVSEEIGRFNGILNKFIDQDEIGKFNGSVEDIVDQLDEAVHILRNVTIETDADSGSGWVTSQFKGLKVKFKIPERPPCSPRRKKRKT